jgi:hypothetical protein
MAGSHGNRKRCALRGLQLASFLGMVIGPTLMAQPTQNGTVSGDFTVERPTLVSLGFEWRIEGDDNHNAKVEVTYRRVGDQEWKPALPLLRVQSEFIGNRAGTEAANRVGNPQPRNAYDYQTPNMFSGSILNLEVDVDYECHFVLSDPDGVEGPTEKTVTVHTRKEPMPATGGHVYHVYPIGYAGPKQEPSFTGIFAAYYLSCHTSDFEDAFPPRVQPGDIIMVHAGVYKGNRVPYTSSAVPPSPTNLALCNLFDGTYYLTASGTADKPIVIEGAGDGEVIFDGDGAQTLFDMMGSNYNYFENITVRNTNVAFLLGIKNIAGSSGFTLKHSRVENVGRVIQDDWSGSKDFYIADNVFIGRHNPDKMLGWSGVWASYPGYPELIGGPTGSEYAVKVFGQGHVVAYNYVTNWHDGIDVATYGMPDGYPKEDPDRFPSAIDFYNNDFMNMGDNCIEADGGGRNIRVFRNRCFNSVGGALSAQPVLGGPAYYYQNLVYNTGTAGALKFVNTSAGLLAYQNTFIGNATTASTSNDHFLNNLIIGGYARGPIFGVTTFTNYSSSDYNGFRPNGILDYDFAWNSPPFDVMVDYKQEPAQRHYKTLEEYKKATGQDAHSILVDYDVFINGKIPDATDLQRLYFPDDYDFRLKPNSSAVDAGTIIPTITDGFTGKAPDLGAYEVGVPIPHYGPRPMVPGAQSTGK